jgi:tricorn protease
MTTPTEGYRRQPTIHGDTVVFACEDDLWTVPVDGGRAWRLTAGVAEASHPRLSPDGALLAFVGRDEGPPEVFAMPAAGGESRRLTFEAAGNCAVAGWNPTGKIVYSSDAGHPHGRGWLHEIGPAGGLPRTLPFGPARSICYGPGGGAVIGRRVSREPAWWKRYRGGTSGDLWIDQTGSEQFEVLTQVGGNLVDPCWVGDRIFFLSDHEGIGNVYSCTTGGDDLRRHTDHDEYYARSLATDGRSLVYQSAGELYLLRPADDGPTRIEFRLDSSRTQRNRRFVPARRYLESATLGPDGSDLAVITRGKAYSFGNWIGPVSQHGEPDGTRYRLLSWLPDHKHLVAAASDDSTEERLVLLTADGSAAPRPLTGGELGRAVSLEVSPAGNKVAVSNHRHELYLIDLGGGLDAEPRVTRLDHSQFAWIHGLAWSWDGHWLAYGFADTRLTAAIKLCDVNSGQTAFATRPVLQDFNPAFDPEGNYLYFIGRRHFDPVEDNLQFSAGFPRGERPYAIALRRDVPSPFAPKPKPLHSEGAEQVRQATEELSDDTPPRVEIDLDGIEDRVVAFPVAEGLYGRIAGVKDKVLYSSYPIEGSRRGSFPPRDTPGASGRLEMFDLDKQQEERLVEGISDFRLGHDRRTLLYRCGNRLRVIRAGEKPTEDGAEPNRNTGWVDLSRVKVSVRPAAEWRQMFREAWRLQRDHFWAEDMSGVDWERMYQRYLPLVDRVTTRSELSDLLWELHGELGTSHAYEMGGEYRESPHYQQGFLGVDWEFDAEQGSYRFGRILRGDVWDASTTSPLNRPGTGVQPGDELLAINGQPVGRRHDGIAPATPGERLVHLADEEVRLTVRSDGGQPRQVSVHAISDEGPARYRDWVEANRELVRQRTGGRVGYLHVPDMGSDGFAEFHRGYLIEHDRDALIIDVRYNRGGSVSQLLLEKLARRRIGYDYPRYGAPEPYPTQSVAGPMVAVTNEWAGSDGDIFSHTFKVMGLGPLIGKRTWGGVIGIWPRHRLADGTITTQPEFSFAFDDVAWRIENYGTDPDIEVDIAPQDYAAGTDPQLERAIEVIEQLLVEHPPHRPRPSERPRLAAPTLPPRLTGTPVPTG